MSVEEVYFSSLINLITFAKNGSLERLSKLTLEKMVKEIANFFCSRIGRIIYLLKAQMIKNPLKV